MLRRVSPVVVQGEGLVRRYGGVPALRHLDLEVRRGDSVAVFGPNGAGKTTLLGLLATVLTPSAGRLRWFDGEADPAAVRRRIGFVSHGSFLYGSLTAVENLRFFARLYRLDEVEARVAAALAEVGLEAVAERRVETLSRGMEQRLALARAFLHDPDLLLLDEPYSGLDRAALRAVQGVLGRAHERGRTVIVTTHDVAAGLAVCDRAVVLARGRAVWQSAGALPGVAEMLAVYDGAVAG